MLTFRDSNVSVKLDGDLLKTMTIYNFNVDHSNRQDRKINCEFGKEKKFINKQVGRKSPRDSSLRRVIKSPAIMASEFSTIFLPENPDELCDKQKLLLQNKKSW